MDASIHKKFLELAGFNTQEMDDLLSDWIKASKRIGLDEKDVEYAVEYWIPKYWNINFLGVRKCIGAWVREIIDISKIDVYKEKGIKIIYGILPSVSTYYYALKNCGDKSVYVSFPDYHIFTFLSAFFNKITPYIEKAEEIGMGRACHHCGINKVRTSVRYLNIIPSPDVIWSWGYSCDEAPKTDEFIRCFFDPDWNYIVSKLPHDTCFGDRDQDMTERVEYIANSLKYADGEMRELTNINVKEEHLFKAISDLNRYMKKVNLLNEIVSKSNCQWISGNEISLFGQPMNISYNTGLTYMEEALDLIIEEISKKNNKSDIEKQKLIPKIGCYFTPFNVPWINNMFRENGVNITFSTIVSCTERQLGKSKHDDPFMVIAEQWLMMPIGVNVMNEVDMTVEKINKFRPDAMLYGFFTFDRWMGAHQNILANIVEEKTKIPHYHIEGDFWDEKSYKQEDLKYRIENICNLIKMNKIINESIDEDNNTELLI